MSTCTAPINESARKAIPGLANWPTLVTAVATWEPLPPEGFPTLDWKSFIADAVYHGVLPIVGERVLSSEFACDLDPVSKAQLRRACQASLIRGLPLVDEVSRVLKAFACEGIPLIPYKGPVLAETLWEDDTLRECADLDFLMEKEDTARAGAVLERLGYMSVSPVADHLRRAFLSRASEEQFRHRKSKLLLELQWSPAPNIFAVQFDSSAMWKRTRLVSFGSCSVLSPSPEDLLLLLSIHGWKHNWGRLIWLADITQLIQKERIDWDWLAAECRRTRNMRLISLALRMSNQIFGLTVAREFAFTDRSLDVLATELMDRMRTQNPCGYRDWHRCMLLARDNNADRVRQVTSFFFTPGLADYATCRLPSWVSFGYRVVRLGRLLRFGAHKEE